MAASSIALENSACFEANGNTSLTGTLTATAGQMVVATVSVRSTPTYPAGWILLVQSDLLTNAAGTKQLIAVLYRTVTNDFTADEAFDYDMLAFFSPVGIESLVKNFPDFKQGEIAVATFGANTTKAAVDAGLRVDIEVPRPEAPSMPAAIDIYMREQG